MATREVRRFGAAGVEFTFDTESGELTGPSGITRLRPQAATVLGALLARPNELVTRDELKKLVWPDTVVEADQGLNFCIRQIRAALGDEAENGKFIETLPRRGYRFVATSAEESSPMFSQPREPWTPRFRLLVALAVCGLIGVAALAWLGLRQSPAAPPQKIAVLPFAATDGDAWMKDLNREIVERLVIDLTSSPQHFGVVGPATTSQFANDPRPHTEIGFAIGVDLVISGSMRRSDSTLFVQGIRTADGVHAFAWRERVWNRNVDSIAESLFQKLTAKLQKDAR